MHVHNLTQLPIAPPMIGGLLACLEPYPLSQGMTCGYLDYQDHHPDFRDRDDNTLMDNHNHSNNLPFFYTLDGSSVPLFSTDYTPPSLYNQTHSHRIEPAACIVCACYSPYFSARHIPHRWRVIEHDCRKSGRQ